MTALRPPAGDTDIIRKLHWAAGQVAGTNIVIAEVCREAVASLTASEQQRQRDQDEARNAHAKGYAAGCRYADEQRQRDVDVRKWAVELLRLYDWRFVLAKAEQAAREPPVDEQALRDIGKQLRLYGEQKKAAWVALREALT